MLTCSELRTICPNVPEDVERTYEQICERWDDVVFTGSQIIGCATKDSDWDFAVADVKEFRWVVLDSMDKWNVNHISHNGVSYITSVRIGKVNLIVDHRGSSILDNWRIATDYCTENAVFNKTERIKVFEQMGT